MFLVFQKDIYSHFLLNKILIMKTEDKILKYMQEQKRNNNCTTFTTRGIANELDLSIYQARSYLNKLFISQAIARSLNKRGSPTFWRLLN